MDSVVDDLLADLEVVAMIKDHGRLCINNGQLSLEPRIEFNGVNSALSWASLALRRWWNQDSRGHTLVSLQCIVLRCGQLSTDILLSDVHDKSKKLHRLLEKCDNAASGIENLKTTYADDASVTARLTLLVQRLEIIAINIRDAIDVKK